MENVLDRINKIDRIGDDENPDNPVNPVKKDCQHKSICADMWRFVERSFLIYWIAMQNKLIKESNML